MGSLRKLLHSSATKSAEPISALGDVGVVLGACGNPVVGAAGLLLKATSGFAKAVGFLTSDERSWTSAETDHVLDLAFVTLCHESFLIAASEAISKLDDDSPATELLSKSMLSGLNESGSLEINFSVNNVNQAAAPIFDVYERHLHSALLLVDTVTTTRMRTASEVRRLAEKRILTRLTADVPIMNRLFKRFTLGAATGLGELIENVAARNSRIPEQSQSSSSSVSAGPLQAPQGSQVIAPIEVSIQNSVLDDSLFQRLRNVASAMGSEYLQFLKTPALDVPLQPARDFIAERFQKAKKISDEGDTKQAMTLWEALRDELKNTADGKREDYAARAAANLGVCNLHRGNDAVAKNLFLEAFQAAPENPKMRFFGALEKYLERDYFSARQLVEPLLTATPEIPDARWLFSDILGALEGHSAVITYLQSGPLKSENEYASLCHSLNESGDFKQARAIAEAGLIIFPDSHILHHAIAFSLAWPITSRKQNDHDYIYLRNHEDRDHISEAVRRTETAIQKAFSIQHTRVLAEYYSNLVSFLSILGEETRCLEIVIEAQARDVANAAMLANASLVAARAMNWDKLELFINELAATDKPQDRSRRLLLYAMLRHDKSVVERALNESNEFASHDIEISRMRIEVLIANRRLEDAETLLGAHAINHPEDGGTALLKGELAIERGLLDIGDAFLKVAQTDSRFALRAADMRGMLAYRQSRWADALKHFERTDVLPQFSPRAAEQAHCLLELDAADRCLELARNARTIDGERTVRFDELEVVALVRLWRYSEALPLLVKLIDKSDRAYFWLKRYELLVRAGKLDEARAILEEGGQRHRADINIHIAKSNQCVLDGKLRQAYESAQLAIALDPNSKEAKLAVARLAPVAFSSGVFAVRELEEITRYATEAGILTPIILTLKDGEPDIKSLVDALEKKTGKRVGHEPDSWAWFRSVGQPLTLGAHQLKLGISPLWMSLLKAKNHIVVASGGDSRSIALQKKTCAESLNRSIVIDPVAILTCDLLDLWDTLSSIFPVIHVPANVAERFFNELMLARHARQWNFPFGKPPQISGEKPLDSKSEQELIERLERITARLSSQPFVLTGLTTKTQTKWNSIKKTKAIPLCAVEAGALAYQLKVPLWSDDLFTSRISKKFLGIGAFPTISVLHEATEKKILAPASLASFCHTLAHNNYRFTPVFLEKTIEEYRDIRGGPDDKIGRLFRGMVNTQFGKTNTAIVLGHMVGYLLIRDGEFGDKWRSFASELLHCWDATPSAYNSFCVGAATGLDISPALYFGLLRKLVIELPKDQSDLLYAIGIEVVKTHAHEASTSRAKAWRDALNLFLIHPPR